MAGKVADASVVAAVAFQEPRAEEAVALLKGGPLYAPELLAYELASVARKKALAHPQDRARIVEALRLGLELELEWVGVDAVEVAELALDLGITAYDAAYVWVARRFDARLATFDAVLRKAAGARG